MSGVERKTSREPNACYEYSEANATSDPRVSKEPTRPRSVDDAPIRDAGTAGAVQAANASKMPSPPPLTAEQARDLPDAFLDRQAHALRTKLSRGTSYPDEARDQTELKTIEGELASR